MRRSQQGGLSLVEVLVGIAVGLIGVLIIFQTMAVWDKHTRTTSSGSDARTAGTLAMFSLERDIKLAGMGFATAAAPVMGCQVAGGGTTFPLRPITISTKADGTDVIDVLYGNSSHFVTTETFTDSTTTTKKLKRRGGFKAGDLVVVATASGASFNCGLIEVSKADLADGVTIEHVPGPYTSFYGASAPGSFNGPAAAISPANGTAYNLGPLPLQNHWEVKDGSLIKSDKIHNSAVDFQIAEGVVNMKAQYGYDTNDDHRITVDEWTKTPPAPIDWTRVLAVRVGILVRSRQFEKNGDTPYAASSPASAPSWAGSASEPFVMGNLDNPSIDSAVALDPNNWRYYRYRVYERVIPLRNMVWGTL